MLNIGRNKYLVPNASLEGYTKAVHEEQQFLDFAKLSCISADEANKEIKKGAPSALLVTGLSLIFRAFCHSHARMPIS